MKREVLNVTEVEFFKAVDRWAAKECERQGLTPDGEAKRRIIGEETVKAIRFPLMSQKEFVSVVFDSKVLNFQEFGDLMKHFNDVCLITPLPFVQTPRTQSVNPCYRFTKVQPPGSYMTCWSYTQSPDCIRVTVNKPIKLHGVQHFGSEGSKYTVSIEVKDTTNGSSLVKKTGSYSSEKDKMHCYFGFDVWFDSPVQLERKDI